MQPPDEIPWVEFDPRLRNHRPPDFGVEYLPDADFLFGFGGEYPSRCGHQLLLVQGYKIIQRAVEDALMRGPYPKVCVAGWLVGVSRSLGVDEHQAVHVPYGLKHDKYRVVSPIEDRPSQVAMACNSHPTKGPPEGLRALARVKRRMPDAEVIVFGGSDPDHEIPAGITYMTSPPQETIVEQIYNRSRVFLNSSRVEGFGLPCIEAMACGCALVTTDNGGSRDYAMHDETALVAPRRDARMLAGNIERLLRGDGRTPTARIRRAALRRSLRLGPKAAGLSRRSSRPTEPIRLRYQEPAAGWPGFYEPTDADDALSVPRAGGDR